MSSDTTLVYAGHDDAEDRLLPEQVSTGMSELSTEESSSGDDRDFAQDPFKPFSNLPEETEKILTFRAVAVGIFCGALMNAANVYMGLISGWGQSASMFGSLVGFAILKPASIYLNKVPIISGSFGPRENNIVQTVATSAGGMSNIFVAAFPAIYQMNLMSNPFDDFWKIITLTALGGFFGIFFATPLRRFFIIEVARDLQLVFPSLSASAVTIRGLHMATDGVVSAKNKMRALAYSFSGSAMLRVCSQLAPGLLWDWHPFTWLYLMNPGYTVFMSIESWGWFIEFSPAFVGSGILIGMNVALSFYLGGVLAWGIIGPILIYNELAFGESLSGDPLWTSYMSYNSLSKDSASRGHPSPRYWLLWPGLLCMVAVSLTELLCQWRVFWLTAQAIWKRIRSKPKFGGLHATYGLIASPASMSEDEADYFNSEESIRTWMWLPGLVLIILVTCGVMKKQYNMPITETLLALILAFFFSLLAIQTYGATDIQPLTAASKASQIVLGAETRTKGYTVRNSQTMNLIGGALASTCANQAADLVGDFRIGLLLRTPPRIQWWAQAIGTIFAIAIAPSLFIVFSTAYPCINDLNASSCPFKAPTAASWRAVAIAVTEPEFPIPRSSAIFAIVFASIGGGAVVVRHCLWTGERAWLRKYHPNFMVMGLGFITPALQYGLAMVIGASLGLFWSRKNRKSFDTFAYAVAAGFVSGEGIGGVLNAIAEILGLSLNAYQSGIGCPAYKC